MKKFTVFEYLYRDASNYKAWGSLVLEGSHESHDLEILESKLEAGSFFKAEQLGIPTLYSELWQYSNGPTNDDHVWHEFHSLRAAKDMDAITPVFSTVKHFMDRISLVNGWNQVTPTEK